MKKCTSLQCLYSSRRIFMNISPSIIVVENILLKSGSLRFLWDVEELTFLINIKNIL